MDLKISDDLKYLEIQDIEETELKDLKLFLQQKIPNWRFHPLVKKHVWNGVVNFFENGKIPYGLWFEIKKMCKSYGYDFNILNKELLLDKDIKFETIKKELVDIFNEQEKYDLRNYQIDSIFRILKFRKSISEIATGSGKTLIIFFSIYFLKKLKHFKNFLIIVPNISLVEQTMSDFYSYTNNFNLNKDNLLIQPILGNSIKERDENCNIVVGTYQSLTKLEKDFFDNFDGVICDESHTAQTKSIQNIFKKLENVKFRCGLSGTSKVYNTQDANSFLLQKLLGPKINVVKANELITKGYCSPVDITLFYLDYLPVEKREMLWNIKKDKKVDAAKVLRFEKSLIINSDKRKKFIVDLICKMKDTTLVLFSNIKDSFGKDMYETVKQKLSDEDINIFYLDGSSNLDFRSIVINNVNKGKKSIIFASFGIFSTGINIPSISNIFLLESYKSDIIVKQSIGRGMRLYEGKQNVKIYDFIDDFSINNTKNFTFKQGLERKKIYKEEKYNLKEKDIKL